jgi:hypothetical protein
VRDLHRICAHVLARAQHAETGRLGLVVHDGAIATRDDALRIADGGSFGSLAELASDAGVELDQAFSVGHDSPPLGDVHEPLWVDPAEIRWYVQAWQVLEELHDDLRDLVPSELTLWPEHMDVAFVVDVGGDRQVNVGASPGDAFSEEPYAYVGPHGPERPGDASFWNQPFGASTPWGPDAGGFLRRGIDLLRG